MRCKPDGWNIVLVGFWNRMIFAPEWVGPRLFPEPNVEALVALLPVMPLIYRDREIAMEIASFRLVFRPRLLNKDQILLRAEEMARKVLQALPETPVQAVGVNFAYKEEYAPGHLLAMFNAADDDDLAQAGWGIGERKLTRRLSRGGDILNLTMTLNGQAVEFECNFHTEIATPAAALHTVDTGRILRLRDTALELLSETYRLTLDEENHDD